MVIGWSMILWFMIFNLVTLVTIRLSNQFFKFIGEGFFCDTELGDATFILFLDLVFSVFRSPVHLSFVISISITAC